MSGEQDNVVVDGRNRVVAIRFGETAIMAIVAAAISVFATQQVLGAQIEALETSVDDLRIEIREMRNDLYQPRIGEARTYQAEANPWVE